MRLLIKFPTRDRRDKFFRVLERYRGMMSGKHEVEIMVTCDVDDKRMNTPDVRYRLHAMPEVTAHWGDHGSKVDAINANMENARPWDVLLLASDDMIPEVFGYDDVICTDMQRYYADLYGCLHYHDGYAGKSVCTIAIMGRNYYASEGMIYDRRYRSLWCDNHWTEKARLLGCIRWIDRVIIRHVHPANDRRIKVDKLYRDNNRDDARDHRVYLHQKALRFGLGRK